MPTERASVFCPWCRQPKKLVVKVEMIYLPKHKTGDVRNKDCPGSGMPVAFNKEGDEPTDGWQ